MTIHFSVGAGARIWLETVGLDSGLLAQAMKEIAADVAPGREEQVLARSVPGRVREQAGGSGSVSDEDVPVSCRPLGAADVDPSLRAS